MNVPDAITAKWSVPLLDEGFIPFPKRLLRCLSNVFSDVNELQAVLAIVDYRRKDPIRPPSYDFLAFTAGISVPELKDRVERLREKGYVTVTGIDDAITIDINPLLARIEELTGEAPKPVATEADPF